MTPTFPRALRLLAAALVAGGIGTAAQAQTSAAPSPGQPRHAQAAPIEIAGAQTRVVPADVLSRLTGQRFREPREVLDIRVAVGAEDLAAMPDALQPFLLIGRSAYPVQRVEYDNWNLEEERPINPDRPVGAIRYLHFLVVDWRDLAQGEPMFLTVLSVHHVLLITDDAPSAAAVARVLPETKGKIPRYDPGAFLKLGP